MKISIGSDHRGFELKNKLVNYLTQHKSVSFIAEYIGESFIEFGIFVKNPYDLRVILEEEVFSYKFDNHHNFQYVLHIFLQAENLWN